MSKLTAKTTEWLKEAEQKYIDGMPAVTDENRKRLMQIGLDAVRDELKLRAQKKSDPQPTGKTRQLPNQKPDPMYQPTTPKEKEEEKQRAELLEWVNNSPVEPMTDEEWEAYQEWKKIPREEKIKQHKAFVAEMDAKLAAIQAPTVAPKSTAKIHFARQQYPGQYTRGELWSDVRQNFKLVLLSATFRRCLNSGNYSELWSMVLYVKLWQGIHEGLKKLEGGKDYTMEELLIRHWSYGEDLKAAGRVLADFLKQPKPE